MTGQEGGEGGQERLRLSQAGPAAPPRARQSCSLPAPRLPRLPGGDVQHGLAAGAGPCHHRRPPSHPAQPRADVPSVFFCCSSPAARSLGAAGQPQLLPGAASTGTATAPVGEGPTLTLSRAAGTRGPGDTPWKKCGCCWTCLWVCLCQTAMSHLGRHELGTALRSMSSTCCAWAAFAVSPAELAALGKPSKAELWAATLPFSPDFTTTSPAPR